MMDRGAFVIAKRRDRLGRMRWRWSLIAKNGEPVASSETYNSEASALHGIDAVKALAADATVAFRYDK